MNANTLKDVAASIRVTLPGDHIPSGSITVAATNKGGTAISGATATLGTYTLGADAAVGDASLTMPAWGSARVPAPGDEYILAHATTPDQYPTEHVVIEKVSGTTLHLTRVLENAWASASSTLAQSWIDVAVTSAGIGSTCNRRNKILCSFTDLGTGDTVYATRLFDIVAHIPENPVTLEMLQSREANLERTLWRAYDNNHESVERAIHDAFEQVQREIYNDVRPDLILSDDQYTEAVVAALALTLAKAGYPPYAGDWGLSEYFDNFNGRLTYLRSCITALDEDQDGNAEDEEADRSVATRFVFT